MVVEGVELSRGGVGEPSVADAAGRAAVGRQVAGERDAELGLPQGLAELCDDLRGSVVQAVEDAQQAGADVLTGRAPRGRVVSGEPEQVVALFEGEVESLRDGGDHLLGWLGSALPLEPRVVVGRHVTERGHFLPPQPACPAALPPREADVFGLQRLPAMPEKRRQFGSVDHHACLLRCCFVSIHLYRPRIRASTAYGSPLLEATRYPKRAGGAIQ